MAKSSKNRASKQNYISQDQLGIEGFESPFSRKLNPKNRWVVLSKNIPWDILVSTYNSALGNSKTGAASINARVAIGYPEYVLVDKIYCTRANRKALKDLSITLRAKPLGRPKAVDEKHVSPGERNPIEGKFGQAKTAYGLNRIKARLQITSQSWIASIILVLNLVKLAGEVLLCRVIPVTYSARQVKFEPWIHNYQPQLKLAA